MEKKRWKRREMRWVELRCGGSVSVSVSHLTVLLSVSHTLKVQHLANALYSLAQQRERRQGSE
jgi:hypothetical protein